MTALKKNKLLVCLINISVFIIIFILHYCDFLSIKILCANPFLPLTFLIAVSIFGSELTSFITGLCMGVLVDTCASTTFGFNAIIFMIIGFSVSFIIHYLFNRNIRSGIALGIIFSVLYFLLRFLFFNAFDADIGSALNYLLTVSIPSAIYTAVFIFPFYFFEKHIFKKML